MQRIAILGIFVQDHTKSEQVNALLHEYAAYIIGRLGVPYRERSIAVICIVMDAEHDVISALSGKLGRLEGVQAKVQYAK